MDKDWYTYGCLVQLVDKSYTEILPGEGNTDSLIWMLPIQPLQKNNMKQTPLFVFNDWEDYQNNGKDIGAVKNTGISKAKRGGSSAQKI